MQPVRRGGVFAKLLVEIIWNYLTRLKPFIVTSLDWISIFLTIKMVQFSQRIISQFLKVGIPKGRSTSKFLAMVKRFNTDGGYSAIWAPKVGDVNATIRNKRVATRTGNI